MYIYIRDRIYNENETETAIQHISFTAYYKNKYLFTMPTIISQFHKEPEYTETYLFFNIPFIWHLPTFGEKEKEKAEHGAAIAGVATGSPAYLPKAQLRGTHLAVPA